MLNTFAEFAVRFVVSDSGRDALQQEFRRTAKSVGLQCKDLTVIYSEDSLREHRKARSLTGQSQDRSVTCLAIPVNYYYSSFHF